VTAPFDRLKIYLITTGETASFQREGAKGLSHPLRLSATAASNLWLAVTRIYRDGGGVRAFWVGNGLNVTKIFPVRNIPHSFRIIVVLLTTIGIRD
jgi:solute carrier family 25 phosphate transporter 23/24/25/41